MRCTTAVTVLHTTTSAGLANPASIARTGNATMVDVWTFDLAGDPAAETTSILVTGQTGA